MKIVIVLAVLTLSSHVHHKIVQTSTSSELSTNRHTSRHSRRNHSHSSSGRHRHVQARARYAYPMSLFLYQPPPFDSTPLPEDISLKIRKAFTRGTAADYPTRSLVKAGLVSYYPIRGGIFFRREPIKNIIIHSTEPGIPISARAVIDGWSHGGRRHPGAHYVVERDGTIYQALDPDLAAVHINIFKTLPGFDNDNSVGIEMCHQGSQTYPAEQVQSVIKLVVYLQNHYHIPDSNIVTHRYAQQGDHTDPVNFAWNEFIADKTSLQNQALNYRLADLKAEAVAWQPIEELGTGKAKIFKGNKPEVVDVTKPTGAPVPMITKIIDVPAADEKPPRNTAFTFRTYPAFNTRNPFSYYLHICSFQCQRQSCSDRLWCGITAGASSISAQTCTRFNDHK